MNIVLIGFMGTGKSSIGSNLAAKLGYQFIDTDALIIENEKMPIQDIFELKGEAYFRKVEAEAVAGASNSDNCVISTGGGVVLSADNMSKLRKCGTIVCLKARPEIILERTARQAGRPLLNVPDPAAAINEKLDERCGLYSGDLTLDTSDMTIEAATNRIIAFVNASAETSCKLVVELGIRSYDIHIGCNMLQNLDLILGSAYKDSNIMVVTNPTIYSLWGFQLEEGLKKLTDRYSFALVPDGEEYKDLPTAQLLYDKAVDCKLDRKSLIIAFGGGVIGDLAGFVASTYMRGIPFIQIPTTLLAQIDSSVGGKVAVNHPRGKNLIGSFYQPKMVISDMATLLTLPERELINGLAEVIKHGMISSLDYFEYLEANLGKVFEYDWEILLEIIKRSCSIKAGVVEMDEKENGIRAVLNYGHTIGHGLEASTDYRHFRHGEAVAIGMAGAADIGMHLGLLSASDGHRQNKLLQEAGLPVAYAGINTDKVLEVIRADKKNENGRLRMIIPQGIGKAIIRDDVTTAVLREVLDRLKS